MNPTNEMQNSKLQIWATEINKDWFERYKAHVTGETLIIQFDSQEVARLEYNNTNGRFSVTGTDQHAVNGLEYLLNR